MKKYYKACQGCSSKITGHYIEEHTHNTEDLARMLGHGVATGPYSEPPSYGWAEGVYSVDDEGNFKAEGSNWDTSD